MSLPMKRAIICNQFKLLNYILKLECAEVLLGTSALSKAGALSDNEFLQACDAIKSVDRLPVLIWDRIEKDTELEGKIQFLSAWLPNIAAIRVQDPGVASAVREAFPDLALQLSLEGSSPNHRSIQRWSEILKPDRLILSNQLPLVQIQSLESQSLPALEIPVLGPLEVFYSPRLLLSEDGRARELTAISEERPRQTNLLLQNTSGTVMFHSRDLFLLDQIDLIAKAGVTWVKLAPSSVEQCEMLSACHSKEDFQQLKTKWPVKVTRGFFSANRTDRPLKRLLNRHLAPYREQAIGQVVEGKKGSHILIELTHQLQLPVKLKLLNPEGRDYEFVLEQLHSLEQVPVGPEVGPGLYLSSWTKGALARSLLLSID